jgi:hypothetical protein
MNKFKRNISKAVSVLLIFIITAILNQIIGNKGSAFVGFLISSEFIALPQWMITLAFAVLICLFLLILKFFDIYDIYNQRMRFIDTINAINENTYQFMDSLLLGPVNQNSIERFVDTTLRDMASLFPGEKLPRISIFRPDKEDSMYLRLWKSYGASEESMRNLKFYLGEDETLSSREKGIAGRTFKEKTTFIAQVHNDTVKVKILDGDTMIDDKIGSNMINNGYIFSQPKRKRRSYKSFMTVPILSSNQGNDKQSIGVICFDSDDDSLFRKSRVRKDAQLLASYVTHAMSTYNRLRKSGRIS